MRPPDNRQKPAHRGQVKVPADPKLDLDPVASKVRKEIEVAACLADRSLEIGNEGANEAGQKQFSGLILGRDDSAVRDQPVPDAGRPGHPSEAKSATIRSAKALNEMPCNGSIGFPSIEDVTRRSSKDYPTPEAPGQSLRAPQVA